MIGEIIISPTGDARHVYSEKLAEITAPLGTTTLRRASHVEPTSELSTAAMHYLTALQGWKALVVAAWWADMIPSCPPGSPEVLGPFATRQEALDAEAVWLREHNIPVLCEPCRVAPSS